VLQTTLISEMDAPVKNRTDDLLVMSQTSYHCSTVRKIVEGGMFWLSCAVNGDEPAFPSSFHWTLIKEHHYIGRRFIKRQPQSAKK
jgi:hypothetical protein